MAQDNSVLPRMEVEGMSGTRVEAASEGYAEIGKKWAAEARKRDEGDPAYIRGEARNPPG